MTQRKILFDRPVWVSPHAVKRFQERVADLPAEQIIFIVQAAMQVPRKPHWAFRRRDGVIAQVYLAKYAGVSYGIPLVRNEGKEWPVVPTILGPDQVCEGSPISEREASRLSSPE